MEYFLANEAEHLALSGRLAGCCPPPLVVYLHGDLGTGKTTLVRGWLRALGYGGLVKSPSYTLLESYQLKSNNYYHFDLYRLSDPEELDYLGVRDLLEPHSLLWVEWPERGQGVLPAADLSIHLDYQGSGRVVTLRGLSPQGRDRLANLK